MGFFIQSKAAIFGQNYQTGFAGFQFTDNDIVSIGIAYFSRWTAYRDIPISHTFIVSGDNECVEALGSGVHRSSMTERFGDPHTHVFFRKPKGWTPAIGDQIKQAAEAHIGDKYGYGLIVADALAGNALGKLLNIVTFNWANRVVSKFLDSKHAEICSELVAMALRAVPSLAGLGCLTDPPRMIVPSQLFSDEAIFEPWAGRVS